MEAGLSTDARPQLKSVIGRLVFSPAFGSMIGAGWITSLGNWFEKAGATGGDHSVSSWWPRDVGDRFVLCGSHTDAASSRGRGRLRV